MDIKLNKERKVQIGVWNTNIKSGKIIGNRRLHHGQLGFIQVIKVGLINTQRSNT